MIEPMARYSRMNRSRPFALLAAVALGAVIVLVVAGAFSWHPTRSAAAAQQEQRASALAAPPGTCLSWQQPGQRQIGTVDCARPHLFETIGKVTLPAGDRPPAGAALQQLSAQRCTAQAASYLGGPLDSQGKYSVGALAPDAEQWSSGEHTLVCGLRAAAPSGKQLFEVTGSVRGQDQSNVYEPGTCVGLTDKGAPGDPTECAKAHAYEIVGTVDEKESFGNGYPSESKQRHGLVDRCTALAKQYTKLDYSGLGLQLTWDTIGKDSWAAGSHKINCKVAALKKDGSGLKTTTGTIRG